MFRCVLHCSPEYIYWLLTNPNRVIDWIDWSIDLLRDWAKGTAAPWRSVSVLVRLTVLSTPLPARRRWACKNLSAKLWLCSYALRSCKAMDCTWLLKLSRLRSAAWYLALASAELNYVPVLHQELEAQDALVPNAISRAMPEQRPAATPVPHQNQLSIMQSRA